MKSPELTNLLNQRLDLLESVIAARPRGGDTNSLRLFLNNLLVDIRDFQSLLDRVDGGKNPKSVYKKPSKTAV